MKIMIQTIILILTILIVSYNAAYAQYSNESVTSSKQPTLQEQLDVSSMQEKKHNEMEHQIQDIDNAIVMMEIGLPLGVAAYTMDMVYGLTTESGAISMMVGAIGLAMVMLGVIIGLKRAFRHMLNE